MKRKFPSGVADEWWFPCFAAEVVDGDTIRVRLDMGFECQWSGLLRLAGVDTPEIKSKRPMEATAGIVARAHLQNYLIQNVPTWCISKKRDKYGRSLGDLHCAAGVLLTGWLLSSGLAQPTSASGARAPWTDEALQKIIDLPITL